MCRVNSLGEKEPIKPTENLYEKCSQCDGKGYVLDDDYECGLCDGSGKVPTWEYQKWLSWYEDL